MSGQLNIKFKNYEEVQAYSQQNEKTLVIFDDYVLDVSSFQCHHPGGAVLLKNKHLKTVDEEMKFHHPLTLTMANTMVIGSFKKQIQRLIDPNVPLMPQIWNLNHQQYMKVVDSPHWLFVPSPRMFQTNFFEGFSHIKWFHILFIPAIIFCYLFFFHIDSWANFNPITAILAVIGGFLLWTLIQYVLHRFVFHSQRWLPDNRVIRYLHYVMHGVHHMLPNDPDRLVHPPVLVIIEICLLFPIGCKIIPIQDPILFSFFWTAFMIGYISYDLTHWSLHHIDTSKHKGSWFHKLQQYHNQHHFGGEEAGFGVSSPLWDWIIGTTFKKQKKDA